MIQWITSSSVLIAVILVLRLILKGRVTPRVQYALWLLVLIRLLVPFNIGATPMSVANVVPERYSELDEIRILRGSFEEDAGAVNESDGTTVTVDAGNVDSEQEAVSERAIDVVTTLEITWISGAALVLLITLTSNTVFAMRLRRGRHKLNTDCQLPVYVFSGIQTPCLAGLFKPAIYVTPHLAKDPNSLNHVLEHELAHYRHADHIWAWLRCVALALHWYNPLVWLAAERSKRDAELACDEAAVAHMGESERFAYGRTLIELTCPRRAWLLGAATAMTGSRKNIKERVSFLAKRPRMAVVTFIVVLIITLAAAGCTFTGGEASKATEATPAPSTAIVTPASEAAAPEPVSTYYENSFSSADGTVAYTMQFSLDGLKAESMPVIALKPHEISVTEAQNAAKLIFGDTAMYVYGQEQYSKEELDRYLGVLKQLQEDKALKTAVLGEDPTIDERINNLLEKYGYTYDSAPYAEARELVDWTSTPASSYLDNIGVAGKAELDGYSYYFGASNRSGDKSITNGIWAYIDAGFLASVPHEYYCYELASETVPSSEQIASAAAKAQNIINGLDMGQWQIVQKAAAVSYGGRYMINIQAAPEYDGYPVLYREYSEYYHQVNMTFTFAPNGTLVHFMIVNPCEAADYISKEEPLIDSDTAMEAAKAALTDMSARDYDIRTSEDVALQPSAGARVAVDSACLGYGFVPTDDSESEFKLIPVYYFTESFELYNDDGEVILDDSYLSELRYICVNAIDGSILE